MQEDQNIPATTDPLNLADEANPVASGEPATEAAVRTPHRKIRTGVVVSDKMQKSIVVAVTRRVRHPLYKKYFNVTSKFMAHDEESLAHTGDTVRIVETRPLSARKRWRLDAIVEKAK